MNYKDKGELYRAILYKIRKYLSQDENVIGYE
jgi:hypothetical protein